MINNKQLKGYQAQAALSFPFPDAGPGAPTGLTTTLNGSLQSMEMR
ncbi:hypothetical protein [Chitinophaga sp. YR627]|nr:hypothetical protein [Chitinophaga sp. YR627]